LIADSGLWQKTNLTSLTFLDKRSPFEANIKNGSMYRQLEAGKACNTLNRLIQPLKPSHVHRHLSGPTLKNNRAGSFPADNTVDM